MQKINRNQAEEIFNNSDVIQTKINQSKDILCLVFDLSDGKHLQMNYRFPEGEKTYFLLKNDPSLDFLESQ